MNQPDDAMNHPPDEEDFDLLEQELAALTPAPISGELFSRVDAALLATTTAPAASRSNVVRGFFHQYGQAAAAAVLLFCSGLLFLVTRSNETSAPNAAANYEKVDSNTQVLNVRDKGVTVEGGVPVRHVEIQSNEQEVWEDPANGARLKVNRPREDKMLISLPVH